MSPIGDHAADIGDNGFALLDRIEAGVDQVKACFAFPDAGDSEKRATGDQRSSLELRACTDKNKRGQNIRMTEANMAHVINFQLE